MREAHPRLYTDRAGIDALRRRLAEQASLRERFESWREKAEALLEKTLFSEEYADSEMTQHGKYYEIGSQLMAFGEKLGLLYVLTGERRYADKIRDALLHYAAFTRWTGPANQYRDPPWQAELATTQLLLGCALGYDFCYDALSVAERETVERAMLEKGIRPLLEDWVLPGTRVHALDSMGHNWWAVCIGLAGIGLLAVYERVPEAADWMTRILEALRAFCAYPGEQLFHKCANFDEAGLFYESLGYCNYGIGELLRFAFVYKRCGGDPAAVTWPALEPLPQAVLSMLYPTSRADAPLLAVNFGDSGTRTDIRLFSLFWLLTGHEDARLSGCYQAAPAKDRPASMTGGFYEQRAPYEALDFLYEDILWGASAPVSLPETRMLFPSGCAVLRDTWQPDAAMWAVRCGYTWNHAHEDAGSFLLYDRGVPLLTDSGNCSYGEPLYSSYYRRATAHNVVLMDGAGPAGDPVERGSVFSGSLSHLLSGSRMTYLLADATGPMAHLAERNFRNFLWIGRDMLVILDDIRVHRPVELTWLLHYEGEAAEREGALAIRNGPAAALIQPIFPEERTLSFREGYREHDPEHTVPYAAFTSLKDETVQSFLTVILLDEAMDEVTAEPLAGIESLGVRLRRNGEEWTVWYNLRADGRRMHVNSNQQMGGYETDAYLLADGPEELLLAGGSYLRRAGRSLRESYEKQFIVCKK